MFGPSRGLSTNNNDTNTFDRLIRNNTIFLDERLRSWSKNRRGFPAKGQKPIQNRNKAKTKTRNSKGESLVDSERTTNVFVQQNQSPEIRIHSRIAITEFRSKSCSSLTKKVPMQGNGLSPKTVRVGAALSGNRGFSLSAAALEYDTRADGDDFRLEYFQKRTP